MQHAKSEVAVGLERYHPKFCSQSQSLSVGNVSRIERGRVLSCIDLAEKSQAPCLMAAFLMGAGQIECMRSERHSLITAAGQQIGLAQPGHPAGLDTQEVQGNPPLDGLFKQWHGLGHPPVQGIRRPQ
jgi:hypothetical protein